MKCTNAHLLDMDGDPFNDPQWTPDCMTKPLGCSIRGSQSLMKILLGFDTTVSMLHSSSCLVNL